MLGQAAAHGATSVYLQAAVSLPHLPRGSHIRISSPHSSSIFTSLLAPKQGSLVSSKAPGQPVRRLASSGCDNCVKVGGSSGLRGVPTSTLLAGSWAAEAGCTKGK